MAEIMRNQDDITRRIFTVRGKKVMLDRDLAELYGVKTGNLNKAAQRNQERFPEDFMFQLTPEEFDGLRFQFGISKGRGGVRYMPYVFTEQGVIMLASVLSSPTAVEISIRVVRAFVRLRQMLLEDDALRYAIQGLERRMSKNERDIQLALTVIQQVLMPPKLPAPTKSKYNMGFGPPHKKK
jgi:hypothetical protein